VYVKSLESHHIRALLSSRKAVLAKCIDLENEIRGLFKIFGIKLPPRLGHGSFDRTVRETIETDPALSHALLPLLDVRLDLYRAFRELDTRTRKIAHADEICRRLMTAPGVGFVTALTFKAAVDDPARFKRSRTLAAHFGLTPRRVQSGELNIEGHISRCGDRDVRSALYTAANTMMTRSSRWSSLKAWGIKLAKQRGHRRTVIAVARKLAVILHNGLTAAGITVVCLETHHVKEALKAMRNKTDRNDARGIAQLLRSGWYRPVHVKSLASREIRALLCSRRVILKQCIDFKAGVDDPTRFKHSRLVAAHFGLTPKREQSGEMAYDGHISRKGDAEVRCALYVAAHALLTRQKHASALKA
jgi:transposase